MNRLDIRTEFAIRIYLILFLAGSFFSSIAETSDTIIYKSSFEKSFFDNVRSGKQIDDVLMFTIFDGDSLSYVANKLRLETFYAKKLNPKLRKRDDKTKGKIIFEEVHKEFLKTYVDTASFSDVFRNSYNCVSGTALYAIVLNHYGIPYEIHEIPTHVYLIAWPETHAIKFESTSPYGFMDLSKKYKDQVVNDLMSGNFLTKDYVERIGSVAAYNNFFFSQKAISLQNLAGIQYINQYISEINRRNYIYALALAGKCDLLFPSKKMSFYKVDVLENLLLHAPLDNVETFRILAEYTNLVNSENSRERTLSLFQSMMESSLLTKSDEVLGTEVYTLFNHELKSAELLKNVEMIYNGVFARYYLIQNKFEKSLEFGEVAYKTHPENTVTQSLIRDIVIHKISPMRAGPSSVKFLDEVCTRFPFLREDINIRSCYVVIYTTLAYSNFAADNEKDGLNYLTKMEEEIKSAGPDFTIPETAIGYGYAEAGSYYYRIRQYKKAIDIMNKGLTLAPDHPEINVRLKIVKEEMRTGIR